MKLNFREIPVTANGQPEKPVLRLRTLADKELGAIGNYYNLSFEINYSDLSKMEFSVPYQVDGVINPVYKQIVGHRVVYTDHYGVYIIMQPTIQGDGIAETKQVTAYSLEQVFAHKSLFLEEGTYNFWNPVTQKDTILGRILELDPTWHVGYVAPSLIGRYRTFDQHDGMALSFLYGDAMEKYRCVIVFDVYEKSINAYDADDDTPTLPIYLSYENLVENVKVDELTDEVVTKLHVYGADDMSIHDVNPAGTDYIIDLSWFIERGDLNVPLADGRTLAEKVQDWQLELLNRQQYYTSVSALRASQTALLISEKAALTELNGELEKKQAEQSVLIQSAALDETQKSKLPEKAKEIADFKEDVIRPQEDKIKSIQATIDGYAADLKRVNDELAIEEYFEPDELEKLSQFFIEGDVVEETFVVADVDPAITGTNEAASGDIEIANSNIVKIEIESSGKTMYTIEGGTLVVEGYFTGAIIRGTLEVASGGSYVMSAYVGASAHGDEHMNSGLVTMSGSLSGLTSDISKKTTDEIVTYEGTKIDFVAGSSSLFVTANASDYQKFSVQQDLYKFGASVLDECARPVYEFTIDSANFIFIKEFEPFKSRLELGGGIHLKLASEGHMVAKYIGATIDMEDYPSFGLTFSNQYQKKDGAKSLYKMLTSTYSSSRSFDANKYIYNKTAGLTTDLAEYMNGMLNSAVQTIQAAANQSVIINGAGIHVGGEDGKYQLRIVDNMIAMSKDNWQTASLAIGLFKSEKTGEQWGVNANVLAGDLTVTRNLVIQNPQVDANGNPTGVMQFEVTESGAWLHNSTFVLTSVTGGKILLDPRYGIVGGTKDLYTTNGTIVTASFVGADGSVTLDEDGMPKNSNFYLDVSTGKAYFRGTVIATDGKFSGTLSAGVKIESPEIVGGSIKIGPKGDGKYAFTVDSDGNLDIGNGQFTVDKNGNMIANSGRFHGAIYGNKLIGPDGEDMMANGKFKGDYVTLKGITIKDNSGNVTFQVTDTGLVSINGTISGNITMGAGSTIQWDSVTGTGDNNPIDIAKDAKQTAEGLAGDIEDAVDKADTAKQTVDGWKYTGSTKIDGSKIYTGTVYASYLRGGEIGIIYPDRTDTGGTNVGGIDLTRTSDGTGLRLYTHDEYGGIKIDSGGNVFISTTYLNENGIDMDGPNLTIGNGAFNASGYGYFGDPVFQFSGGFIRLSSQSYGTDDPNSANIPGDYGQIYFRY